MKERRCGEGYRTGRGVFACIAAWRRAAPLGVEPATIAADEFEQDQHRGQFGSSHDFGVGLFFNVSARLGSEIEQAGGAIGMGNVPFTKRRWCSVTEAYQFSGLGRTWVFEELAARRIESKLDVIFRASTLPPTVSRRARMTDDSASASRRGAAHALEDRRSMSCDRSWPRRRSSAVARRTHLPLNGSKEGRTQTMTQAP